MKCIINKTLIFVNAFSLNKPMLAIKLFNKIFYLLINLFCKNLNVKKNIHKL